MHNGAPPPLRVDEATENCDEMNVVYTQKPWYIPGKLCLSVVGRYSGYIIHWWMRVEVDTLIYDKEAPLRPVRRVIYYNYGGIVNHFRIFM